MGKMWADLAVIAISSKYSIQLHFWPLPDLGQLFGWNGIIFGARVSVIPLGERDEQSVMGMLGPGYTFVLNGRPSQVF